MPICDGVEAARRIRTFEMERRYDIILPSKYDTGVIFVIFTSKPFVQVIALSADCQESTKQLCLNSGMDAFLSKPANKIELFGLLQRLAPSPSIDTDIPAEMRTSP